MEGLNIRRRNRLKQHFTLTSNVIIFGYRQLTDAEKLTYQAIDSFDWPDEEGKRKGYAFPSVSTLAKLRGTTDRTIQRHLEALERVGLLTRDRRPGRCSVLWIEEASKAEAARYLALLGGRGDTDVTTSPTPDTDVTTRGDTDVTPYMKKDEQEKKTKSLTRERPSKPG
jgi:DNA-binding MarR family transcriptional regulator